MLNEYRQQILQRQYKKLYRSLPKSNLNEEDLIDFSSNDYLGLSKNQEILAAAIEAGREYGTGATGSRLLSGNSILFEKFEQQISEDKNTQAALIFNSGFQANISALSCLLDHNILKTTPLVFFDKLNHASLYQAVFLSKAQLIRYHHCDMNHLSSLLDKYMASNQPKFIISETLFGMDGDFAPIDSLTELSKKHNALLYLDEAHATGLYGKNGYGESTNHDLTNVTSLVMGTFSKAIGSSGAYIACDNLIKDLMINCATGFIYSTAPSPLNIGAAYQAWQLIKNMQQEREIIAQKSIYLREKISKLGFDINNSNSHIIPIIIGKEEDCIKMHQNLLQNGIKTSCIRPPTVSPTTSRIRIAINSSHTERDLDYLLASLAKL